MNKLFFILFLSFVALNARSEEERKFQIWSKSEVVIQPWKNISIDGTLKVHYSPERNAADLKYAELFLSHEPVKWFEYGAGLRVSKLNIYPGWIQENRAMIIANFTKKYNNLIFKYSNRFEYRSFENNLNYFRYRQEFKTEFPSLTSWGMRFYAAEETFFKLNGIGFHLARIYGGLSVVQQEYFELKVFYALEKYKLVENWGTTDIAGLNMSFIF